MKAHESRRERNPERRQSTIKPKRLPPHESIPLLVLFSPQFTPAM
jgi:hypothetical protein